MGSWLPPAGWQMDGRSGSGQLSCPASSYYHIWAFTGMMLQLLIVHSIVITGHPADQQHHPWGGAFWSWLECCSQVRIHHSSGGLLAAPNHDRPSAAAGVQKSPAVSHSGPGALCPSAGLKLPAWGQVQVPFPRGEVGCCHSLSYSYAESLWNVPVCLSIGVTPEDGLNFISVLEQSTVYFPSVRPEQCKILISSRYYLFFQNNCQHFIISWEKQLIFSKEIMW